MFGLEHVLVVACSSEIVSTCKAVCECGCTCNSSREPMQTNKQTNLYQTNLYHTGINHHQSYATTLQALKFFADTLEDNARMLGRLLSTSVASVGTFFRFEAMCWLQTIRRRVRTCIPAQKTSERQNVKKYHQTLKTPSSTTHTPSAPPNNILKVHITNVLASDWLLEHVHG